MRDPGNKILACAENIKFCLNKYHCLFFQLNALHAVAGGTPIGNVPQR